MTLSPSDRWTSLPMQGLTDSTAIFQSEVHWDLLLGRSLVDIATEHGVDLNELLEHASRVEVRRDLFGCFVRQDGKAPRSPLSLLKTKATRAPIRPQ